MDLQQARLMSLVAQAAGARDATTQDFLLADGPEPSPEETAEALQGLLGGGGGG